MREITVTAIRGAVRDLYIEACHNLGTDVRRLIEEVLKREESPFGIETLQRIIENYTVAEREKMPICQDTGAAVVFIDMGQDVRLTGGQLSNAVDEGVRLAVAEGCLRASIVKHPLLRENTGDNTPAILHTRIVPGDNVGIAVAPKGFGSENMSRLNMLSPSAGQSGVTDAIVEAMRLAGGNPCPPVIVGVCVGGSAETAMLGAKRSLLREAGKPSTDPIMAEIERESLTRINALGIGPMGLGGRVTALAVHCDYLPTHIAALPVAINMQCHCARHKSAVL